MYDLRLPVRALHLPTGEWKPGIIIGRSHREKPLYDVRLDDGTLLNGVRPWFAKEGVPHLAPGEPEK